VVNPIGQTYKSASDFYKLQEQMQKLRNEINEKKLQICKLEQNTIGSLKAAPQASISEMSQVLTAFALIQRSSHNMIDGVRR